MTSTSQKRHQTIVLMSNDIYVFERPLGNWRSFYVMYAGEDFSKSHYKKFVVEVNSSMC